MNREDLQVGGLFLYAATTLRKLGTLASELGDDGSVDIGKWGRIEMNRLSSAIRRFCREMDDCIRDLGGMPGAGADENGDVLDVTAGLMQKVDSVFDLLPVPADDARRTTTSNGFSGIKLRLHPYSPVKERRKLVNARPKVVRAAVRVPDATFEAPPPPHDGLYGHQARANSQLRPDSLTAVEVRELLRRQEAHQKQMDAEKAKGNAEIKPFFITRKLPRDLELTGPKTTIRLAGPSGSITPGVVGEGLVPPPPAAVDARRSLQSELTPMEHQQLGMNDAGAQDAPPPAAVEQVVEVENELVQDSSSFLSLQDEVVQGLLGLGQGQNFIVSSAAPVVTASATISAPAASVPASDMYPNMTVNTEEEEEGLGLDYLQTA